VPGTPPLVRREETPGGRSEETPGKTQDTFERLCLSAGLGTFRGPPGRAGGSGRGQGRLGFSAQAAAPTTRPPEKRQIMDGWMDGWMNWIILKLINWISLDYDSN